MGESNSISNLKRGFYTALTAGILGLGALYGCSKDSPTEPPVINPPQSRPPTIELSVSPPSGLSPLETYVLGRCTDPDGDIADYRVMKGDSILTRTNPTDTTIILSEGRYSFYSKCGDKKGNEVTSDTSYVEVTRPPQPVDQLAVASGGCIEVVGDPTMKPCGDSEIFIIDEDGKNPKRLTYNDKVIDGTYTQDTDPNWYPDGTKIIYTSYRPDDEGGVAIWEVDLYGNERRLFGGLEVGLNIVRSPSYSPDGTKIAFTYLNLKENSAEDRHGIAVWDGGNSFDFLTSDPCPRCFTGGSPSWSPNGSRIVFDRTDMIDRIDYEDGIPDIWIMNSDGSGKDKIHSNGIMPDWSADGLYITFSSAPSGDNFYEPRYIYTLKLDDRSVTQITDNPDARDFIPDWSPDGSKIAFLRGHRCHPTTCSGEVLMKVIDIKTGEITQPIQRPPMSWQPGEYLIWPGVTEGFAWRPRQ